VCVLHILCFVRVLQYRKLDVFPLSHWCVPLPQIDWPTMQQYPSSRVCFHRNSALVVGCVFTESLLCFPSHGSNGLPPRKNSSSTYMYHHSLIAFSHHSTMTSWSGDENSFRSWVVAVAISRFRSQFSTERKEWLHFRAWSNKLRTQAISVVA
jgi:hypothetical protein